LSEQPPNTENPQAKSALDRRGVLENDPFSYRTTKNGTVFISWRGKSVTTLQGKAAMAFLAKIEGLDSHAAQLVMAKATGHFKHGNERSGRES
jgi:hypothetical protein